MTTKNHFMLVIIVFCLFACRNTTEHKNGKIPQANKLTVEQLFPENSIGIAYLDTIIDDTYSLTIRFPNFNLPDSILPRDTASYGKDIPIDLPPQTIILFDDKGEIITITNATGCISAFWCENDGGIQYEPTYRLTVDKNYCKRRPALQDTKRLGKISCFAIINHNSYQFKSFYPATGKESQHVIMRGRLSNDYIGYASTIQDSIYTYYDRNAQITIEQDDSGMTDYCIMLQVYNSRQEFELGCCGP